MHKYIFCFLIQFVLDHNLCNRIPLNFRDFIGEQMPWFKDSVSKSEVVRCRLSHRNIYYRWCKLYTLCCNPIPNIRVIPVKLFILSKKKKPGMFFTKKALYKADRLFLYQWCPFQRNVNIYDISLLLHLVGFRS